MTKTTANRKLIKAVALQNLIDACKAYGRAHRSGGSIDDVTSGVRSAAAILKAAKSAYTSHKRVVIKCQE